MTSDDHIELATRHEKALVEAFVARHHRSRFRALLEKEHWRRSTAPKKRAGRGALMSNFEHWVDPATVETVPRELRAPEPTLELLRRAGAPEQCYVLSHEQDIDGRFMRVEDALAYLAANVVYGTILSSVPGELAYHEHVEASDLTWILRAKR